MISLNLPHSPVRCVLCETHFTEGETETKRRLAHAKVTQPLGLNHWAFLPTLCQHWGAAVTKGNPGARPHEAALTNGYMQ